jgi:hypothetical protein
MSNPDAGAGALRLTLMAVSRLLPTFASGSVKVDAPKRARGVIASIAAMAARQTYRMDPFLYWTTLTVTLVNAAGGVAKPDGVTTERVVVCPTFAGVKLAVPVSLPAAIVTEGGKVPALEFWLVTVTDNDAPPPARGWVCMKFEFASRSAVFTVIGAPEGPPAKLTVSGNGEPGPPGPLITMPDGFRR